MKKIEDEEVFLFKKGLYRYYGHRIEPTESCPHWDGEKGIWVDGPVDYKITRAERADVEHKFIGCGSHSNGEETQFPWTPYQHDPI